MKYEDLTKNKEVLEYYNRACIILDALGYTDHSTAHTTLVAKRAADILEAFGYSQKEIELVKIAGFLHDIGNALNRHHHAEYGALLANEILSDDVESVGMPDSWANWGDSWKGLTETYGIAHTDDDMSSAEELNMFKNDSTRDIGDIGTGFIQVALDEDLVQSYKTSYWDTVPEWAKGADGKWMIAYTGCTAFIYNNDLTSEPAPASWEDVRKGSYKLTIGDVVGGATGQGVVELLNQRAHGKAVKTHSYSSLKFARIE